tara:strand:- start:1152 stop:1592 length:441 start_codon:yes stop_codon:yes gene_type:complete
MALHSARWRVHASAVDDVSLIEQSLCWLTGEGCEVNLEKGKSWHGSEQTIIETGVSGRKKSAHALSRLGKEGLQQLLDQGVSSRIDEDKVLHIRISLSKLVCGEISLVGEGKSEPTVKGRFKVESYPGQDVETVTIELIHELILEA